ncbi:2691_t:CDS:1, partial [Acaulospora colombiana]
TKRLISGELPNTKAYIRSKVGVLGYICPKRSRKDLPSWATMKGVSQPSHK